jgi:hypothetical protein
MILNSDRLSACLMAGAVFLCLSLNSGAQTAPQVDKWTTESQSNARSSAAQAVELSEAPLPQTDAPVQTSQEAWAESSAMLMLSQAPASQTAPQTSPATSPQSSGSPSASSSADQTPQQKSQQQLAEEQLKQERKQRLGFLPNFNASYISNAAPLTAGQKFRLMFSTEKDPATIGFSMFIALLGQAEGSHGGYGGGIGGYGKRFGQNYADTFDGAFWGNAVLPSWWHQDPRYFRLGTGTAKHRIIYALLTNVRARHDGTNKWEPNYSNLVGNLISGGISNIYLPSDERGLGSTFEGAATVTAEGGIGSMLEEFYPDFLHYLQRRKARKQARQAGVLDSQPAH